MLIAKYLDEIEILKHISHPNVIRIYCVYEDKKSYYLVTELLKGGELFDFIAREKRLSEPLIAQIMH